MLWQGIFENICGFLNSKGGVLYIGITDDCIIKGVVLSYKDRDLVKQMVSTETGRFYPIVLYDQLRVKFVPVYNYKADKPILDLYVIKIIVLKGKPH